MRIVEATLGSDRRRGCCADVADQADDEVEGSGEGEGGSSGSDTMWLRGRGLRVERLRYMTTRRG